MNKQSLGKLAKKTASTTSKAIRSGSRHAVNFGKRVAAIEMPNSMNWIFSFGFKVGVFLLLKSFLILRYQFFNLRVSGFCMVAAQFAQALVLIACGGLMQNTKLYDEPLKLRRIAGFYGYAFILGAAIFVLRESFNWQFFKNPQAVNWFVDFFKSISKGANEMWLSLLFWDFDLWSAFACLLYFITTIYLHVSFDYADGFWNKVFGKISFLRNASHAVEYLPDDSESA